MTEPERARDAPERDDASAVAGEHHPLAVEPVDHGAGRQSERQPRSLGFQHSTQVSGVNEVVPARAVDASFLTLPLIIQIPL